MTFPPPTLRTSLIACALAALPFSWAHAADPVRLVFQNGRSIPITAVSLQTDKIVINQAAEGFNPGQSFPLASIDHVFGDKPSGINPGIALLLTGKPDDALKILEPIIAEQRLTAKIPGNFWLEPARAALVAYALTGNAAKCTEIGKEISDATPLQGIDSFVSLGKALLLPATTPVEDRAVALGDLTTDNLPADVAAYASFYRGELLKSAKRASDAPTAKKQDAETMESYLMVPCLFPSGGLILNAVAELRASEFLVNLGRREEAVALLNSAIRQSPDTLVVADANKRLESLK
ncbi:MAG: tetratricopeptide repeat protein [Luteolibacter sp.]